MLFDKRFSLQVYCYNDKTSSGGGRREDIVEQNEVEEPGAGPSVPRGRTGRGRGGRRGRGSSRGRGGSNRSASDADGGDADGDADGDGDGDGNGGEDNQPKPYEEGNFNLRDCCLNQLERRIVSFL